MSILLTGKTLQLPVLLAGAFFVVSFFFFLNRSSGPGGGGGGPPAGRFTWFCLLFEVSLCFLNGLMFCKSSRGGGGGGGGPEGGPAGGPDCENARDETEINPN